MISPGEKVIEILPTSTRLIVEAKLSLRDIDSVRAGQKAGLRRLTTEVPGKLLDVSPDRLIDENSGEPYYRARLEITDDLPPPVKVERLYPGMPVEALIETRQRTSLEYLLQPILDSFQRAFVENSIGATSPSLVVPRRCHSCSACA